MKNIHTDCAPAAIGPYSQAKISGGFVFTSGQIALNPETGAVVGQDVRAQAEQAITNLGAILQEAGSGLDHVVKTTCFLADMTEFAAFNEVYAHYFSSNPARSCVAVKTLPKNLLVEVEAVAELA